VTKWAIAHSHIFNPLKPAKKIFFLLELVKELFDTSLSRFMIFSFLQNSIFNKILKIRIYIKKLTFRHWGFKNCVNFLTNRLLRLENPKNYEVTQPLSPYRSGSTRDIDLPSKNWRSGLRDLRYTNFGTIWVDGSFSISETSKIDAAAWKG